MVNSSTATVTVASEAVNDIPTAIHLSLATNDDTDLCLALMGEGIGADQLSYEVVGQPSYGKLTGTVPDPTYTPAANYHGDVGMGLHVGSV